ncbi:MAG: SH3 domain-containing protein [Clostridia bacterium]|nr:SH3 domain-containing protein [Clostridia bacterium]
MHKRSVFILILAVCLALSACLPGASSWSLVSASAASHTEYVKNPTGRSVNVRRGPGKGYVVDAELKPGTKVTVESIEGKWCRISSPVSGWIMGQYLTDNKPAGDGGVIASTMTRYITSPNGKKVNVRTGPSVNGYAVAAQLEPGTEVSLLSTMKDWAAISYNGFTVYVMRKYLTSYAPGTEPKKASSFSAFSGKVYSPNGKKVNMRVSADLKADRIAQLDPWTNVQVIGETGSWYKISWANATGYMMKKYIRKQ